MADETAMRLAVAAAADARLVAPPNPWVGAVIVDSSGSVVSVGATAAPGGPHAEVAAIEAAGKQARGATIFVTLEPCAHVGRTGPCTEAIIDAGLTRVVYGIDDPDPNVAGRGAAHLRSAGLVVAAGVLTEEITNQLAPYLCHRRSGRPYVVVKLAATLDGRIAAANGTSNWITGAASRADVHRLRAESDAVLVGAGTVRSDDPRLTARDFVSAAGPLETSLDPRRFVLGEDFPPGAKVMPAESLSGDLGNVLDRLGGEGILQLLVEGGADVAAQFLRDDLVDRYVIYYAAAFAGGDDAIPMFRGQATPSVEAFVRGRFESVTRIGEDIRVVVAPNRR